MLRLFLSIGILFFTVAASAETRIAYSCDGNLHDRDDWGASPMGLALIASQDMQSRLVHYDFSSHVGGTATNYEREMVTSVLGAAQRFDFNQNVFFNDVTQAQAAVSSLAAQINASSSGNRLKLIVAGPFEIVYRAFSSSSRAAHKYVDIVTHSSWNNDHRHPGTHTLGDLKNTFGPLSVTQIQNQNQLLHTSSYSPWFWLRDSSNADLRFLYDRMLAEGKADVSDSGMIYHALFGDQTGSPSKYRAKLEFAFDGGGGPGPGDTYIERLGEAIEDLYLSATPAQRTAATPDLVRQQLPDEFGTATNEQMIEATPQYIKNALPATTKARWL